MAEQNIEEIDSGFFTSVGTLDCYKQFYKYVNKNGEASLTPQNDYNLPDSYIHVSNNMFPVEHITCREFKPNQFAILGLFDTLKEFYELGADAMSAIMSSSSDKTKTKAEAETEKETELIKAKNNVVRTGKLGLLAMLNTLHSGSTMIDEMEDIIVENDITKEKVVVGSIATGNKIQGPQLWTHKYFINGPLRSKVDAKYQTLDMFYDVPQYFYKNLSAGVYGRTFTLPLINTSSYISSSSASQYEVDDGNLGTVRDLLSKVVGQMSQIGLPSGITWKGDSSSFPSINYTIDLYNKDLTNTRANIDFINNIVAGNMWAQRGLFKSPSSLYDVAIKSRQLRMFYCTGTFDCSYEGKVRSHTISSSSSVAVITPNNIKEMLELNNNVVGKRTAVQKEKDNLIARLNNQITEIENSVKATAIKEDLVIRYKETYDELQIKLANLEKVTLDKASANIMVVSYIKTYLQQADDLLENIKGTVDGYIAEMQKYRKLDIKPKPPKYETTEAAGYKTYMSADGSLTTAYDYGEKKGIKEAQKTTISTEKNPILEKIENLITTINKYLEAIRRQKQTIDNTFNNALINDARRNARFNDKSVEKKGAIINGFDQSRFSEEHVDAASNIIDNYNDTVSNENILQCINEAYSIAKDYETVKKSDKYTTKSNAELDAMAKDYDNAVNTAKSNADRLEANKKFHESKRTPYQNAINDINKTKADTNKYYDNIIAECNKEINKLTTELNNAITSLTPTLTHIPDIFKLTVGFSSLLPNNLNSYLYSIEYNSETQADKNNDETKKNDGVVVRPPKLAQFVNTFRHNFKELGQKYANGNSINEDKTIQNAIDEKISSIFKADLSIFKTASDDSKNYVQNMVKANQLDIALTLGGIFGVKLNNPLRSANHPKRLVNAQRKSTKAMAEKLSNTPESAGTKEAVTMNTDTKEEPSLTSTLTLGLF